MNIWQAAQQVKYLLQQQVWTGGATVFARESVLCLASDSELEALDSHLVLPCAVVVPGGGQSDPQAGDLPSLWSQELIVALAARNFNDRTGQAPVMGASRVGITDSRGRGVLELEQPLMATIERLVADSGIIIALKSQSGVLTRVDQQDRAYAIKEYTFEVTCTSAPHYPPARRIAGTNPGAGQAYLTWANPPSRYDRYRMVVRRAAGSSAPATPTSGTGVTLGSSFAETVLDTGLAAGTYSYSVFAMYDDFTTSNNVAAPGSDVRYSDALSKTVVVT